MSDVQNIQSILISKMVVALSEDIGCHKNSSAFKTSFAISERYYQRDIDRRSHR